MKKKRVYDDIPIVFATLKRNSWPIFIFLFFSFIKNEVSVSKGYLLWRSVAKKSNEELLYFLGKFAM